jgi:cytoskeletal protein RodZ
MAGHKKQKQQQETEAPRPPASDSVGETLRAARQARKLEIDVVAKSLHIRPAQLKAIEENNIELLPGMTYAVGFVRSYANFIGLNGADIVHRFKAEHGHDPAQSRLSFPQPVAESRVPDPMMVGVGAFLAVVILVLWTVYSNVHGGSTAKTADKIPPAPVVTSVADSMPTSPTTAASATVPATTTTATTAPVATTGTGQTAATTVSSPTTAPAPGAVPLTQSAPAVTTTPETQPAPAAVAAATPLAPAVTVPAAPVAKAPAKKAAASDDAAVEDENADDSDDTPVVRKAGKTKSDDDDGVIKIKKGKSRITLRATSPSWIQVTDAHKNVLYRKVLRSGEEYSVPDQPGLILDTANAGALDISVDGESVQPLGKNGDILRGVALTPRDLKSARIRD